MGQDWALHDWALHALFSYPPNTQTHTLRGGRGTVSGCCQTILSTSYPGQAHCLTIIILDASLLLELKGPSTVVTVARVLKWLLPGELGVCGELRDPMDSSLGEYSLEPSAPIPPILATNSRDRES